LIHNTVEEEIQPLGLDCIFQGDRDKCIHLSGCVWEYSLGKHILISNDPLQ